MDATVVHTDRFMKTDVVGVMISLENTRANLLGQLNNKLTEMVKQKDELIKAKEDVERFKPDYTKAIGKIKKKAIIPQLNPNKELSLNEITEFYNKTLGQQNSIKEQLKITVKKADEMINWLKEELK